MYICHIARLKAVPTLRFVTAIYMQTIHPHTVTIAIAKAHQNWCSTEKTQTNLRFRLSSLWIVDTARIALTFSTSSANTINWLETRVKQCIAFAFAQKFNQRSRTYSPTVANCLFWWVTYSVEIFTPVSIFHAAFLVKGTNIQSSTRQRLWYYSHTIVSNDEEMH